MFFWSYLAFLWSNRCWQFDLWFLCLSNSSLYIWKFSVYVLLKPSLKNFEQHFASIWNELNCVVVGKKKETSKNELKLPQIPKEIKFDEEVSTTQYHKIGKRKMWVIFCISIMLIFVIFSTFQKNLCYFIKMVKLN